MRSRWQGGNHNNLSSLRGALAPRDGERPKKVSNVGGGEKYSPSINGNPENGQTGVELRH